jgi:threonine synthase
LLDQLSLKIPAYESIITTIKANENTFAEAMKKAKAATFEPIIEQSKRFRDSLCAFYVDLFEIFQSIARVFSNKHGSECTSAAARTTLIL